MKKIKEFSGSGPGFYFTCILYEDYTPPISKPDGTPFVEGDFVGVKIDLSAGRCFFIHNGKVVEEDRSACK